MDYETAMTLLAEAVAADPFRMEHFRKYGFWSRIVVNAGKNGKPVFVKRGWLEMSKLEDRIDVFNDPTGVTQAIHGEARRVWKATLAKKVEEIA